MSVSFFSEVQNNAGWYSVHIVVPVMLPFLVLAAVATATDGLRIFWKMLRKAVDGGQLYWVALGMLTSTSYEAIAAYDKHPEIREFISWTIGLCISGTLFSTVFITLNAVRAAEGKTTRPIVTWLSVALIGILCFYYPQAHFKLQ